VPGWLPNATAQRERTVYVYYPPYYYY